MVEAVRNGKLVISIGSKVLLSHAAGAQAAAEKGGIGKVLLFGLTFYCEQMPRRDIGDEKDCARNQPRFETKWRRMCRMPGVTERLVVSSPSVCGVWAHRML